MISVSNDMSKQNKKCREVPCKDCVWHDFFCLEVSVSHRMTFRSKFILQRSAMQRCVWHDSAWHIAFEHSVFSSNESRQLSLCCGSVRSLHNCRAEWCLASKPDNRIECKVCWVPWNAHEIPVQHVMCQRVRCLSEHVWNSKIAYCKPCRFKKLYFCGAKSVSSHKPWCRGKRREETAAVRGNREEQPEEGINNRQAAAKRAAWWQPKGKPGSG